MRRVFANTLYWVALTHRKDQSHHAAVRISRQLTGCHLITTDEVLTEVLAAFFAAGPLLRQRSAVLVRSLHKKTTITIHPQSRGTFLSGLDLYEARLDKGYSLTDCISMNVMRRESITEDLTHDDHFQQEGFTILL
jgi:predicted nucleic acid-binding protein